MDIPSGQVPPHQGLQSDDLVLLRLPSDQNSICLPVDHWPGDSAVSLDSDIVASPLAPGSIVAEVLGMLVFWPVVAAQI